MFTRILYVAFRHESFSTDFCYCYAKYNTQNSRLGNNCIGQEIYNYDNIRTYILLTIIQPGANSVFSTLIVLKGIIVISYSQK